ncbi:MAG: iron ABC transporter substrate-binding protein, partial [Corynebacterium casei]|nr:iron ABC transporter substrate-binding protein [Corynebacterium casei]
MKIRHALVASVAAASLVLASCSNSETDSTGAAAETTASDPSASEDSTDEAAAGEGELVVEDNFGEKTISLPVENPVVTDNRAFELLAEWDVELAAAPIFLIPDTLSDKYNEDTIEFDLGSHFEPDLEQIVAAQPDLIWNG